MQEFLLIAKALGDEARLRALLALKDEELCLCQLIELLRLSPSTVSRHLSVLAGAGLVEQRREGKWRFFRLPAPLRASGSIHKALDWAIWSLRGEAIVIEDQSRLQSLCTRDLEELAACYRKPTQAGQSRTQR